MSSSTAAADVNRAPAITIDNITRIESSILLYAETCLVDRSGLMQSARMNGDDIEALNRMQGLGLVKFGRIPFEALHKLMPPSDGIALTHWIEFADEAWALAHQLRRRRSDAAASNSTNLKRVRQALAEKASAGDEA